MAGPTDREAAIRLTLGADDYLVNIRRVGQATEQAEKTMVKAGRSATVALNGAKQSLSSLAASTGALIRTAGGLAAAFSLGASAKRAMGLREQFRDLEFQINKTGKAQVDWNDLYKQAFDVSQKTGESIEGVGAAMSSVFAATGDAEFARGAVKSIGDAASATGQSIDGWGNAAQLLQRKFGATAGTIADMMAIVVEKTGAGGLSLEDMSLKFGLLAGEAADAGFKGAAGLSSLLGLLTNLDSRVGEKSVPGLKILFQTLKDGSSQLKALGKESGVKFTEGTTAVEKIRALLASEKGRGAIEAKLTGETRVVFDELVKPFDAAAKAAKEGGAKTKEATDQGLAAFDRAIGELSKSTLTGAKLAEEGSKAVLEDPRVKLKTALDKLADAMLRPKLISAIDKLADKLPGIADWFAKLLDFAVDHPLLAAGGVVGGVAAKGAVGGLVSNVAAPAVGGVLKDLVWQTAGKKVGSTAIESMAAGAATAGGKIGSTAVEAMGAPAGLTKFGKALAIVAAAELAYELGKMAIDSQVEETNQGRNKVAIANAATAEGVDVAKKKAALEEVRVELARLQQEMGGGGTMVADEEGGQRMVDATGKPIGGPSPLRVAGMLATGLGNQLGLVSDEDATVAANALPNDIARAKARLKELEDQIAKSEAPPPAAMGEGFGTRAKPEPTVDPRKAAEDTGNALARRLRDETLKVRVVNIDYASYGTLDPVRPQRQGYFDLPAARRGG